MLANIDRHVITKRGLIVSNRQLIAVRSITNKKNLEKLRLQLVNARQCLVEKERIIEGLRLDLAHLVDQLPRLKQNNGRSSTHMAIE